MNRSITIILSLLLLSYCSHGQSKIWGEAYKNESVFYKEKVMYHQEGTTIFYQTAGKRRIQIVMLDEHANVKKTIPFQAKTVNGQLVNRIETGFPLKSGFCFIYLHYEKKSRKKQFFSQVFDYKTHTLSPVKLIAEATIKSHIKIKAVYAYPTEYSTPHLNNDNVLATSSSDQSKFAVLLFSDELEGQRTLYTYTFDEHMKQLKKYKFVMSSTNPSFHFHNALIDNQGNVSVLMTKYYDRTPSAYIQSIIHFSQKDTKGKLIDLPMGKLSPSDIDMKLNTSNQLVVTALLGRNSGQVSYVHYHVFDPQDWTVKENKKSSLSREFLINTYSIKEQKKYRKNPSKPLFLQLYNNASNLMLRQDGCAIITGVRTFQKYNSLDKKFENATGSLFVICLSPEGQIKWTKNINRGISSSFSRESYTCAIAENNFYLFYNKQGFTQSSFNAQGEQKDLTITDTTIYPKYSEQIDQDNFFIYYALFKTFRVSLLKLR